MNKKSGKDTAIYENTQVIDYYNNKINIVRCSKGEHKEKHGWKK